jgi:Ca2+-binding EF-hand superfamily protein
MVIYNDTYRLKKKKLELFLKLLVLRQVFQYFDKDNSGSINASEMDKVLSKLNVNLSQSQLEKMMKDCDLNSNKLIQYIKGNIFQI